MISKQTTRLLTIAIALSGAVSAHAQDIDFEIKKVKKIGPAIECDENSVFSLTSGGDHSLVFSNLGLQVDNSIKRSAGQATKCTVKGDYTIPKGYYLNSYTSSLTYGIVKNEGSSPRVISKLSFSRPLIFESIFIDENFRRKDILNEPLKIVSKT